MIEAIPLHGTYNFREVTGTTSDGLSIRPGYLFRSDALSRVGRRGRAHLARLGVRRVIDLRTDFDRRFGGTASLRGIAADRVLLPLHGGSAAEAKLGMTLASVYRTILGQSTQVAAAIRAIAEANGPVVVHCTAGKDRTGLVVALTLIAIGVPEDQVIADYAATEANLAGEWEQRMLRKLRRYNRLGIELTDGLKEVVFSSPESAMRETLAWLEAEFGSVPDYLTAAGLTNDDVARLRATLLSDARARA